ncbi:MAG: thiol-disulfide oxidoreductase DCC family protein [Actinomycetota bacterium]
MSKATLLFDADCGFCRWTAGRIRGWDRRDALHFAAIQSQEGSALLGDMDDERKMASWHLVGEDGVVRSAGPALGPLLKLLPFGAPLSLIAGALPKSTDRLYRLVARNREKLGRLLGEQACAVDPTHSRSDTQT